MSLQTAPHLTLAPTTVIYVHGLWLTGLEAFWLKGRVARELACEWQRFHYRSVSAAPEHVIDALYAFIARSHARTVHLVGHSLGGVVILGLLEKYSDIPPGRVVLLGSPLMGSRAARHLARLPLGKALLGRTATAELLTPKARHWDGRRELGIIAGCLPLGLGRVVGALDSPHDGVIAVAETRLPGAADHIVLRASHISMLFSPKVARQTAYFLREGRFKHEKERPATRDPV